MITYRLTDEDLISGNTLWRKYNGNDAAIVCSVFAAWAIMTFTAQKSLLLAFWPSVVAGFFLGLTILGGIMWLGSASSRRKTLYYFHSGPSSLREELTVDWSAGHIGIREGESYNKIKWSDLRNWSDDDRLIVLLRTGPIFYALPKRAFTDEQIRDLHACMQAAGIERAKSARLVF